MVLSELTARYRIFYEDMRAHLPARLNDRAQYQELRGNGDARIYVCTMTQLAVFTESGVRYRRLLKEIPGAVARTACTILFPPSSLPIAAEAIHARKRRQVTEADRERGRQLAEQHGFKKA